MCMQFCSALTAAVSGAGNDLNATFMLEEGIVNISNS